MLYMKKNAIESKNFHIFNTMDTNTIISQIGNTPLVKLKQASELTDVIFMVRQSI